MCTRQGAPARRAAAPQAAAVAPAAQAAAPQAAPTPAPQTSGLTSDTGVQDMDDATLTALITRALSASITSDGRQNTPAQRIADALGLSANKPESVRQEALAQYRGQTYEQGTIYRTVNAGHGSKTAQQIAHELTDSTDYGLNFGGGRCWGTGLYFAGTGPRASTRNYGAIESAVGYGYGNAYTIEAHIKPTARIATASTFSTTAAKNWAKAHTQALARLNLRVNASGNIINNSRNMSSEDVQTTVAMLMGYDGFRNGDTSTPYYTIWNRAALQVARGNKYARASARQL